MRHLGDRVGQLDLAGPRLALDAAVVVERHHEELAFLVAHDDERAN
jgi:hypothetical protein